MGMKVRGTDNLTLLLQQIGPKAVDAAREEMRKKAYIIRNEARFNAPSDFGALEKAIIVIEDREGINTRKRFSVTVDEGAPGGRQGTWVAQYAMEMHESVYKLGKISRAKQAQLPGTTVGRKYLERAMDEILPTIKPAMIEAVKKVKGID